MKHRRTCRLASVLLTLAVLTAPVIAHAHGSTLEIGSTAGTGSDLVALGDLDEPFPLTDAVTISGTTYYTGVFPSFEWPTESVPEERLYTLPDGLEINLEIVEIDPGASLRLGAIVLDQSGDEVVLGTVAAGEHVHVQWQLTLPAGEHGQYAITFRLKAQGFIRSERYTVVLSNEGSACAGDCDGNGEVTVDEILVIVNMGLGTVAPTACEAADLDGSETVTVDEIVTAVNRALEGCPAGE